MTRHTTLQTMLWLVLLAWPTLVRGHSELVAADPPPGAQLAVAPAEIRLTFSTQPMPGSTFAVWGKNFRQVSSITPQIDPQQPNQLFALRLPPLAAGDYTVQWTTVDNDGHTISGSYVFRVAATGAQDARHSWLVAIGAVALVLLIRLARCDDRFRWLHESFWH